jgi:lipopolysaccharide transport system ATP-binding protein
MVTPAIQVDSLSKLYKLGQREAYKALRDVVANIVKAPIRRARNLSQGIIVQPEKEQFLWALDQVSFKVQQGEVLGIIGRNGAGKSTLLKILSRITKPTSGKADIYGRVGSLLEVGTGFHPELTGRENIYMNGAILGMKRVEIDRKFDEIVGFSEVEKFLDTPVKRYSSGMFVRLAFSVAAHLDPEILIIDEVLAVGDLAFQRKCLGKMSEVAEGGRTVLFVSHNLSAIRRLCEKSLLLEEGKLAFFGETEETIEIYQSTLFNNQPGNGHDLPPHIIYQKNLSEKPDVFSITSIETLDINDEPMPKVSTWDRFKIRVQYFAPRSVEEGALVIRISTKDNITLLYLATQPDESVPMRIRPGYNSVDCVIEELPLSAGEYIVGCGLSIPNIEWLCWDEQLSVIRIHERDVFNSGSSPKIRRSLLAIPHEWRFD